MFSNTSPKGEAVLNFSCSPVRCQPMKPVLTMHWPIWDGQGTAAVSSLARPPQGQSGPFALPHLQTGCDGSKKIFILGLGEEYGWVGFFFFFFLWGKRECLKIFCAFGGFANQWWQHPEGKGARREQEPLWHCCSAQHSRAFQGSAVYDWAFLVSIINKHINVITAGEEIKLGLRL